MRKTYRLITEISTEDEDLQEQLESRENVGHINGDLWSVIKDVPTTRGKVYIEQIIIPGETPE